MHPKLIFVYSSNSRFRSLIRFNVLDQIHIRKGSEIGSTRKSTTSIRSLAGKRWRLNTWSTPKNDKIDANIVSFCCNVCQIHECISLDF